MKIIIVTVMNDEQEQALIGSVPCVLIDYKAYVVAPECEEDLIELNLYYIVREV
jgi:hypothetical protein